MLRRRQPCIVVDNIDNWKAPRLWCPQYLKAVAGNRKVPVREIKGPPRNVYQQQASSGGISFAEYLDWMLDVVQIRDASASETSPQGHPPGDTASEPTYSYYLALRIEDLSPLLVDDIEVPNWYKQSPMDIFFWCGVGGTSSGLHSDISPNCNVQVSGRKQFTLFSPGQSALLYPVPGTTHCLFDPNAPDYDRFPAARNATAWDCVLEPTESLYIPVGWYHQVTVASDWAVNINFFWPRPFPQGVLTPVLWKILLRRYWARFRRGFGNKRMPQAI
jgi:Cupin-like domain